MKNSLKLRVFLLALILLGGSASVIYLARTGTLWFDALLVSALLGFSGLVITLYYQLQRLAMQATNARKAFVSNPLKVD